MAERVAGMAKKRAKKASTPSAGGTPSQRAAPSAKVAPSAPGDRVVELEAECARLKAELVATQTRLEALEAQRKQLVDRIDWAIDSLHSLLEE